MAGPPLIRLVATWPDTAGRQVQGLRMVKYATGLPDLPNVSGSTRAIRLASARNWAYRMAKILKNDRAGVKTRPQVWHVNKAAYIGPATQRMVATIESFTTNVDVRLGIEQGGSHCLYFRVLDYDNWWRLRFVDTYFTRNPQYAVVLEACVNGRISQQGATRHRRGSVRYNEIRVVTSGTSIAAYTSASTTPFARVNNRQFLGATRHGFGRGGDIDEMARNTGGFRYLDLRGVNLVPNAPVLETPRTGFSVDVERPTQFRWRHSDNDAGDTQSAYRFRYRNLGEVSWTTIERGGPNGYHVLPAGTLAPGAYEWTAATRDSRGGWGPYARPISITTGDLPTDLVIVDPTDGERITTPIKTVHWVTGSQDAYEVRVLGETIEGVPDTARVTYATPTGVDADVRSRTLRFTRTNEVVHIQVRVRLAGLWSPWASVRAVTGFTPPMRAQLTLDVDEPRSAITVRPTAPARARSAPRVEYVNVWRVENPDPGAGPVLVATQWPPETPFTDYTVRSGIDYGYMIETVAVTGSTSESSWRFDNLPDDTGERPGVVAPTVTTRV